MMLYIASTQPLPTIAWIPERPSFHVVPLCVDNAVVAEHLTHPYVYYAGSHEGCGCGFTLYEYEVCPEGAHARAVTRLLLASFVESALRIGAEVALFSCWSGDENDPPDTEATLDITGLTSSTEFPREHEVVRIADPSVPGPDLGTTRARWRTSTLGRETRTRNG